MAGGLAGGQGCLWQVAIMAKGAGESGIAPFAGDTFALRLRTLAVRLSTAAAVYHFVISESHLHISSNLMMARLCVITACKAACQARKPVSQHAGAAVMR